MLEWLAGLAPIPPLVAALWIGVATLFGQASGEPHERRTSRIVLTACAGSLMIALILAVARLAGSLPDRVTLGRWLTSGDYQVDLVFATDGLSLALAALVALLCLFVARFAVNYMHREAGFHRLFMVLSLFTAAILLLVMGGNAVLTFVGCGYRSHDRYYGGHYRPGVVQGYYAAPVYVAPPPVVYGAYGYGYRYPQQREGVTVILPPIRIGF